MSELARKFPATLIKASAGSGKTFQLSNRILSLLLSGEKPERILATTFTRKAAGEIGERVFTRLAKAALSQDETNKLAGELELKNLKQSAVQDLLIKLIHSGAALNISTLDGFFLSITKSFALELGLSPSWSIAESQNEMDLRRRAILALCKNAKATELSELMQLVNRGENKASVHVALSRRLASAYETWRGTNKAAWNWLEVPSGLKPEALKSAISSFNDFPIPLTQKQEPNKTWSNAHAAALDAIQSGDWNKLLAQGFIAKILAKEQSFSRAPISEQHIQLVQPLITHARSVILGKLRAQISATEKLLSRYSEMLEAEKKSLQILSFQDVKHLLFEAKLVSALDELYYRLDSRLAHILLDEFQDTSREEWCVIEPIVDEILSKADGEHSFFCVGDTKQAIYGWRGGVAEIFDSLEQRYPILAQSNASLDKSYRSAPQIIESVNKVFSSLDKAAQLHEFPDVLASWKRRFLPHTTAEKAPGYVEIRSSTFSAEEEDANPAFTEAARLARDIQKRNPELSIGILVRRNESILQLLTELSKDGIEIQASGEGGNPLTDSIAVRLVLSALRLADHPGDSIVRFHVAKSALGKALEFTNYQDDASAEALSLSVRTRIQELGLSALLDEWTGYLKNSLNVHDLKRLTQLKELAFEYTKDASPRISDFISTVELTSVENPSTSKVRVMTIHKSKGLEFDAVILPELDLSIRKARRPQLMSESQAAYLAPERVSLSVSEAVSAMDKHLSAMYAAENSRQVDDALSVLYVSMTRAKRALFMLVTEPAGSSFSCASILRNTLEIQEAKGTIYQIGNIDCLNPITQPLESKKPRLSSRPSKIVLASSRLGRRRGLLRLTPSELEGGPSIDLTQRLRLDTNNSAKRGTTLHTLCESIEWLDGNPPIKAELLPILERTYSEEEATQLCTEFLEMLKPSQVAEIFSLPKDAEQKSLKLYRELPFAYRQEDSIITGTLDRLVQWRDKSSKSQHVEVIDFKTDRLADSGKQLQERIAFYAPQMETYRQAAAKLTRMAPGKISLKLVFLSAGRIVEL